MLNYVQEPDDNGDLGNVYGGCASLYVCGILFCRRVGSIRRSNNYLHTNNLFGILDCVSCFDTRKPTSSVFRLAYLFHMLLLSTSTTVSSTAATIGSISCPLMKKRHRSPVTRATRVWNEKRCQQCDHRIKLKFLIFHYYIKFKVFLVKYKV